MSAPDTITEDEWIETCRPLPSPTPGGGFDYGSGCTLLDWTKPADVAVIDAADPACVWTVIDRDDGPEIVAGHHHVDRLGHIVTELPSPSEGLEVVMDD